MLIKCVRRLFASMTATLGRWNIKEKHKKCTQISESKFSIHSRTIQGCDKKGSIDRPIETF